MKITWLIYEPRYFFFLKASKLVVGLTKGFLRGKALSVEGHIHDDRYYTESEIVNLLAGKANSYHTHDASQISGVLPANKGGTGVTTLNALKTLLGIDTSENSITKIVSGTYKGTGGKYDYSARTITVSGINKIKFLIVSAISIPPVFAEVAGVIASVYSLFGFASNTTIIYNSPLTISSDNTFTVKLQKYPSYMSYCNLNLGEYTYMYLAFGT